MARGKYAPFRLWALIVAWIFQLLFLIVVLGLYIIVALALSWSSVGTTVTYAGVGVEIALAIISMILIITEIILCASSILEPLFYLVSNVLKSAIWIGLTVATLVINHGYEGDTWTGIAYNGIGIGVCAALLLLFLILLTYSAVLYHRDRTGDGGLSAYTNPAYIVPTAVNAAYPLSSSTTITHYEAEAGAGAIPHPDFIDLGDGQGHGFTRKSKSRRGQRGREGAAGTGAAGASNVHKQSPMSGAPLASGAWA